ncbi:MAG: hypothetical protein ACJ8HQ_06595 [Chthoniobacterales bacterium]
MKTLIISLTALMAVCFVTGCTSTATTAQNDSTRPIYTTEKKVYSKEYLDKTGRQTPAEALAEADPSITVTHR